MVPDPDDPCATAVWLWQAIHKVAAGETVQDVRSGENRVSYGPGDLSRMQSLYRTAVSECARKNGKKSGRRAFVGRIVRG